MKKEQTTKPSIVGVITGDIHYNLNTLPIADTAVRMAITKANELGVSFIANGDLLDQKALMRAEYVNAIIETFKTAKERPIVNVGNHSLINTKGKEHALNFLKPYADVIEKPEFITRLGAFVIPYYDNADELRELLASLPKGHTLIMHQGLNGGSAGEYIRDNSALNPSDLAPFRAVLSHYHARQDIKCGKNIATYIGSPYSITFGEANDLPKGYQILHADGSLEFVPTNLRKHVIIELTADKFGIHGSSCREICKEDLVWVKVSEPKEFIQKIDKAYIRKNWVPEANFKLDLIPTATTSAPVKKERSVAQLLDAVIDDLTDVTPERKAILKELWKGL